MDQPILLDTYSNNPKVLDKEEPIVWKKFGIGETYFGLELELTYDFGYIEREIVKVPQQYFPGMFVWKEELSVNGAELILAPQTIDLIRSDSLQKMLKRLKSLGAASKDKDGCGLHVHINKEAVSDTSLRRIREFFTQYSYFIKHYSGRTFASFAEWCEIPESEEDWAIARGYDPKGVAINQEHPDSVEFRIFGGTLSYSRIVAAVEFVDSLVRFVRTTTVEEIRLGQAFIRYLDYVARRPEFSYLAADLNSKKINSTMGKPLTEEYSYKRLYGI